MAHSTGRLWVGTAGWSYADWAGRVYPHPTPAGFRPLQYLSRFFDCVEVNVTFYRQADRKLAEGWVRQVRERAQFAFLCKLHQSFTHGQEAWGPDAARAFLEPLAPLRAAGRLAALLVQLPWSARFDERTRERLARIAEAFAAVPLVLEVRHACWDRPEAFAWMQERRFDFCNIDQPALRDCLPPTARVTGSIGYVRLHGRNSAAWFAEDAGRDQRYDYGYSDAELDEWVPRVERLLASAPNVYVIGNNHYRGQAAANALQLRAKLTREKQPVPPPLVRSFPELGAIAAPAPAPVERAGPTEKDAGPPRQPGLFDALDP